MLSQICGGASARVGREREVAPPEAEFARESREQSSQRTLKLGAVAALEVGELDDRNGCALECSAQRDVSQWYAKAFGRQCAEADEGVLYSMSIQSLFFYALCQKRQLRAARFQDQLGQLVLIQELVAPLAVHE